MATGLISRYKNAKQEYEYYKSKGVCTRCKINKPTIGRVICQNCKKINLKLRKLRLLKKHEHDKVFKIQKRAAG